MAYYPLLILYASSQQSHITYYQLANVVTMFLETYQYRYFCINLGASICFLFLCGQWVGNTANNV